MCKFYEAIKIFARVRGGPVFPWRDTGMRGLSWHEGAADSRGGIVAKLTLSLQAKKFYAMYLSMHVCKG